MKKALLVRAEWDEEVQVWVATSENVPGLATEADAIEALCAKLDSMVPELLSANGYPVSDNIRYELVARRFCLASTSC